VKLIFSGLLLFTIGCGPNGPVAEAPTVAVAPASSRRIGAPEKVPSVLPGEPFVGPKGSWLWFDVDGSQCGNGSPTGVGVNLTDQSDDVLVFFEGGGACWDAASCFGVGTTAVYENGYGKLELSTDPQLASIYLLNRGDPSNPFRDKNMVYVPYCTGDVFSGDNVVTLSYLGIDHQAHFVGHRNVGLFLSRILGTFRKAKHVWVAGDSAGGFGAAFQFGRVQDGFATTGARVDLLDDSGQPVAPDPARWELWKQVWSMQLPSDCPACTASPAAITDYYREKYPDSRFGLISYQYDIVISPFMNLSLGTFHDELYSLTDHMDATWPSARYFVIAGASHVGLTLASPELKDWVARMVSDSPSWGSSRP
jgi:hypothetical protein